MVKSILDSAIQHIHHTHYMNYILLVFGDQSFLWKILNLLSIVPSSSLSCFWPPHTCAITRNSNLFTLGIIIGCLVVEKYGRFLELGKQKTCSHHTFPEKKANENRKLTFFYNYNSEKLLLLFSTLFLIQSFSNFKNDKWSNI